MIENAIQNRYEFVILFDVINGNPNGDPDAGNMPRVDAETGVGLVTDVCLKRKIRNFIDMRYAGDPDYQIYIKQGVPLNRSDNEAFHSVAGIENAAEDSKLKEKVKEARKTKDPEIDKLIREYMCSRFFDIRTFGAVMTTMVKGALNCGQIRGPVQLSFARSVDPVIPQEITITRVAITTESDAESKNTEMGNKYIVPYGLYRCEGYVSAALAQSVTGFSDKDMERLWEAILNMFEEDHSAARGQMAVRQLIIFKHESVFGNAPAHKLFDLVNVQRRPDVDVPRSYADYDVTIDYERLPSGVTCEQRD